ncbi:uncharacterized protein MEPE_05290 [Melanopsichium pennsylvanicum]|uniref:Uncharacterized protein n=1 Tax=Melanopsichium pennsylvanicum TaxID=63383 RepID=A0AAJ5C758_9BASI|nr:uncharacterized protein MEPE_05290 [Melanopsichium pennsylvanicum]
MLSKLSPTNATDTRQTQSRLSIVFGTFDAVRNGSLLLAQYQAKTISVRLFGCVREYQATCTFGAVLQNVYGVWERQSTLRSGMLIDGTVDFEI